MSSLARSSAPRLVEPAALAAFSLRFYFDLALTAPLIVILLGFFAAGALFGVLALVGTLLRQRREISLLKQQAAPVQPLPPPPPF